MISLWSTDKTVIMDSKFCVLKRILGIRKRGVYGIVLIKKRRYWPTGFTETALTINSGQKYILVMWDILVVNGMRQSLFFLNDPDYNIMMM